jgi:alpha-N-arabinofuranosidase
MMKWVDPSIELVACGSCAHDMPTYGTWEMEVLNECYNNVDYVSLHRYYGNPTNDTAGFLARAMDLDDFIREVVAICDAVGGKKHAKKKLNLSFDEWNVWYHSHQQDKEVWKADKWGRALPLLEDVYNFEDALLAGTILITFLKNADRVKVACLAQLVNVIAPIMTRNGGGAWAQTIFYPMMHASQFGRGTSLRPVISSPVYDCSDYENVPLVDAAATLGDDGSVTIFAVNRDLKEDITLACDLRAFSDLKPVEHIVLHHDDVKAVNTEENPDEVTPVKVRNAKLDGGKMNVKLPALSWNVIRLAK